MVLCPVFNPLFLPPGGGVDLSLFQLRMQQIPIVHPHVKDIGERREQIGPRRIEGNDAVVGIKQNKAVRDGIQPIPKRRNFGAQRRLGFSVSSSGPGVGFIAISAYRLTHVQIPVWANPNLPKTALRVPLSHFMAKVSRILNTMHLKPCKPCRPGHLFCNFGIEAECAQSSASRLGHGLLQP